MTNPLHQHLICYVLGVAMFQLPGTLRIYKQKAPEMSSQLLGPSLRAGGVPATAPASGTRHMWPYRC